MRLKLACALLAISWPVYANNVTDTLVAGESPVAGDILYYSGISGNTSGTWAQPSSIPGLQGPQGIQGIQGVAGVDGINGTNGTDGVDGATGPQGVQGAQGVKGDKGDTGKQGLPGLNGLNATAPAIDPRLDVEVREYDAKHWSVSSYASFGMQNATSRYIVGQKLVLKLGTSYEGRLLEAQAKEIERLKRLLKVK